MTEGLSDAQIIERLLRLERNVKRLADEAGVELEDPSRDLDPAVVELAQRGQRMEAAALLAERTGMDFVAAQATVADL